jgi:hypothetical protein
MACFAELRLVALTLLEKMQIEQTLGLEEVSVPAP